MNVKPVEYKLNSLTAGFAVAGDKKDIDKKDAPTIKKDSDNGATQELDKDQSTQLEGCIDGSITEDKSSTEVAKVSKDGKSNGKNSKTEGATAVAAAFTGGLSAAFLSTIPPVAIAAIPLGGFAQYIIASGTEKAAAVSLGLAAIPSVIASIFTEKKKETNNAESVYVIINESMAKMTEDQDQIAKDAGVYQSLIQEITSA